MGYQPRVLEKFESIDTLTSQLMPPAEFEWQSDQEMRAPLIQLSGTHGVADLLGTRPGVLGAGADRVRCAILETSPTAVDTALDALVSKCWSIGQGKLFTIDSANDRRWAYARLRSFPSITWRAGDIFFKGVSLDFARISPTWFGSAAISSSAAATGTVVINNTGNAPVYNAVLTLFGTFTNPVITNTTTGYVLQTNRDGTSNDHRVKFDSGANTVEFSSNAGGVWADDYANFVRAVGQIQLMKLNPGNNSFTFSGVASGTLAWSFYPAWLT